MKTSSQLLDCCVNHSLVEFIPCTHSALTHSQGKVHTVKIIFEQIVCCIFTAMNTYVLHRNNVY